MDNYVTLTIDGRTVTVPPGMNVVDAAKTVGIDIPVFCHHPKLKPVGMCRMCLVEVGRPQVDRATGSPLLNEDGSPKIIFGAKLETACTTPVSQGMVVWGATEKVMEARKEMMEFLLTSHPLDCPVCDKGGECPLQNLTMQFGSPESHFLLSEKSHSDKHIPLGELITLDRERCIQCARCIRFEEQIVGDAVIGFYNRGRSLEIATFSEPGFDSIFSGNTTDICPVGALTTNDFRFGARSWEMQHKPSICSQCAVGCNITYDIRRDARHEGHQIIKRVMPRQNEEVNEIWMCDKGRFTHAYIEEPGRLTTPLIRKGDQLMPASWEDALQLASEKFKAAGNNVLTLVGGGLSLEDMVAAKTFTEHIKGSIALHSWMGGGEALTRVGMTGASDLGTLGKGSVILVVASDLHAEAPIWWLRVKAAAERGATIITMNARSTRLETYATHTFRYLPGEEQGAIKGCFNGSGDLAEILQHAENLVVFVGSDGLGLEQSTALMQLVSNGLIQTGHFGKPNNGMIAIWPHANDQGACELGIHPKMDLAEQVSAAMALYVLGADPAGDAPGLNQAIQKAGFVVVQTLFLSETAKLADVVLPAQAIPEREGAFVSGERRVQKFAAGVPAPQGTHADHAITAALLEKLGGSMPSSASEIFDHLALTQPVFNGMSYAALGVTKEQWPHIGRNEVYYGGTGYDNTFGLGLVLPLAAGRKEEAKSIQVPEKVRVPKGHFLGLPATHLYDGSLPVEASLLKCRIAKPVLMHPEDAKELELSEGMPFSIYVNKQPYLVEMALSEAVPQGSIWVGRNHGIPLWQAEVVEIVKDTSIDVRGAQ